MPDTLSNDRASTPETPDESAWATPTSYVTFTLIALNVLVFVAMLARGLPFFSPTAQQVIPWGANFGPLTVQGQWWRLFTACFLHFGIVHIGMNMFILFQVGRFTETLLGGPRYLLLYLLAGIGGNIAGLYLHPLTVGAGASGAIFGVYGGLLAFLLVERGVVPAENSIKIAKSAGIFLAYNLIYGLLTPHTDVTAHIGGLLTGFVLGCLLARPLDAPPQYARTTAIALGAGALAFTAAAMIPASSPLRNQWLLDTTTGPSITVNRNDRLIYTGTATPRDAFAVAQVLTRVGIFQNPQALAVFHKDTTAAILTIPVKGDDARSPVDGKTVVLHAEPTRPIAAWNNPVFLATLQMIGPEIATAAGAPALSMRLVNEKGEVKNQFKVDTAEIVFGQTDRIAFSSQFTPEQVKALGAALQSCGFFRDLAGHVLLTRTGSNTEVSLFVSARAANDPRIVDAMTQVGHTIAPAVGGTSFTLRIIDSAGQSVQDILIH